MARVLIVDDEKSIRRTLGEFLRDAGYEVAEAEDADAALTQLRAAVFDVVVTDIILPRVSGVELLRLIQDAAPDVQVVMMTGEPTVETAAEALRLGAADYLFKPIDKAAILRATGNAARIKALEDSRRRLEAENQAHRENLERLVAERTAQLQASEVRYRTLFEGSRDAIITADPRTYKFLSCNPAAVRMFGAKSEAELVFLGPLSFSPERQPDGRLSSEAVQHEGAIVLEKGSHFFEWMLRRLDGEEFAADVLLSRIEWDDRPVIMATVRDITDRKQAEAELRRLATAVEQAAECVMITDTAGAILYANPAFEGITGYTRQEAIGQNSRILKSGKHDEAFYQQMWDTLSRGEVWQGHFINQKQDGSLYEEEAAISPVRDVAGNIVHYVAVSRDVTAQVALEAQLRQAQKMEALGTLASGVAHEINNPLFGIRGFAELIGDSLPPESELKEYAAGIIRQADHVAKIVRNLLTFARQDKQEPRLADPNGIVQSVLSLLQTVVRHDQIKLRVEVPEGLPPVVCHGQQIEQVLMNLLTNARDALNEKYAGCQDDKMMSISAGVIQKDGEPWLRMTVEDHGPGIPANVRERIFDPFFTTKPVGKGTGLGLSISHGMVKEHGGELHFETEPGRGTQFHVDLPLKGPLQVTSAAR